MSKSTFALSIATLFLTLSTCSAPGSDIPEPARLATAVAGTLEAISKVNATPNPRLTPGKLGTGQPDDSAAQSVPPTDRGTAPPTDRAPTGVLRIAYTSAGNVWLIEETDPPRQLSHTGHADRVLLSSDGALVAYVHNDFESDVVEFRVLNTDGSGDRVVLDQVLWLKQEYSVLIVVLTAKKDIVHKRFNKFTKRHKLDLFDKLWMDWLKYEKPNWCKCADLLIDTSSLTKNDTRDRIFTKYKEIL